MKKTLLIATILLAAGIACSAGGLTLNANAEDAKSLLLEQTTQGDYVYDPAEKSYTASQNTDEKVEVITSLKGARGWLDEEGKEHPLTELDLHYKVRMNIVKYAENHTVPSLIIAESEKTITYVQNRLIGELFLLEDQSNPYKQTARKFEGLRISEGSYMLEADYLHGSINVSINGEPMITGEAVNGNPVFRLGAFGFPSKYTEFELTTTSPVASFVKAYPDPAEGNENLLAVAGYANTVRPSGGTSRAPVEVNGTTFTMQEIMNGNLLIENDYLSGSDFYRPDIKEHSDGGDLDYLVSADIVFGEYLAPTEPWFGGGIIFGETASGYLAIRCMKTGEIFVHDLSKNNGDTLYNLNFQGGSINASTGKRLNIKVYYQSGLFSVLVNDQAVIKNSPMKMTPRLGLHLLNNAISVENFTMKFIQPVETAPAEPKSEETAVFDFTRGKLNAAAAKNAVQGDLASFTVTAQAEDYFLMNSKAQTLGVLYQMTGSESFREIKNEELGTRISLKVKDLQLSENGKLILVFRHAASGLKRHQLVLSADGSLAVETGSSTVRQVASGVFPTGGDLELSVYSAKGDVTVYINGQKTLYAAGLDTLPNAVGVGGENASYTVEGFSYKYIEDVKLEQPQKETFPQKEPVGEANTEYIEPPLPEKRPTDSPAEETGCGSVIGGSAAVLAVLVAAIAIAVLKKRVK